MQAMKNCSNYFLIFKILAAKTWSQENVVTYLLNKDFWKPVLGGLSPIQVDKSIL